MKKAVFLLLIIVVNSRVKAQIKKGQWMAGGNVSFAYSYNNNYYNPVTGSYYSPSTVSFSFMPDAGYFIIDKLAGGLTLNYSVTNPEFSAAVSTYGFSPFIRYYVLPVNKKVNAFIETAYGWSRESEQGGVIISNHWSFSGGPVIFLSRHVALEMALNFTTYSGEIYGSSHPGILGFNIGFQVYLGK